MQEHTARTSTPGPNGEQSQSNSQDGSPPLTSQDSLPQVTQTRTIDQNTNPGDTGSPPDHLRNMAGRSKSVSGVARSSTWTDAVSAGAKARNEVRFGEQAQQQQQQQQSKTKGKKSILAVLSGKKSRGKSPASARRYPEGVLGKDGARVWLKDQH